ncbi:unnamed protein product [Ectocarpus sp. 12 AP-2014]
MTTFSTLNDFGDHFINQDVMRAVSFFLNQRDKIATSTSASSVHRVLKHFLPPCSTYITTVRPNFLWAFSSDNGVYSAPIKTFAANPDGYFDSYVESMIKHMGCNEDSDYYLAWYSHHLIGKLEAYGYPRRTISLEGAVLNSVNEALIVLRLRESVDLRMFYHDFFPHTPRIMHAFEANTSICDIQVNSHESPSCLCGLFKSLSRRTVDIQSLELGGEICHDATQMIADDCVKGLKKLSFRGSVASPIVGHMVDILCEAVSETGILESLEVGEAMVEYDGGGAGLIRVLETCPLRSLNLRDICLGEDCWSEMVRVLTTMKATHVEFTEFRIAGDWMVPVLNALFSSTSIQSLDLSHTKIGCVSIGALENKIKGGTLIKLAIGGCSIGRDEIKRVLQATTHVDSKLKFISIRDNSVEHPDIFEGLVETSLEVLHIEALRDVATIESLAKLILAKRQSGYASLETLECFHEFRRLSIK